QEILFAFSSSRLVLPDDWQFSSVLAPSADTSVTVAVCQSPASLRPAEEYCGALLYLLGRHVLLMCGDEPDVAERVNQFATPVAIELILHRPDHFCAGGDSLTGKAVHILDVEMNHHW